MRFLHQFLLHKSSTSRKHVNALSTCRSTTVHCRCGAARLGPCKCLERLLVSMPSSEIVPRKMPQQRRPSSSCTGHLRSLAAAWGLNFTKPSDRCFRNLQFSLFLLHKNSSISSTRLPITESDHTDISACNDVGNGARVNASESPACCSKSTMANKMIELSR